MPHSSNSTLEIRNLPENFAYHPHIDLQACAIELFGFFTHKSLFSQISKGFIHSRQIVKFVRITWALALVHFLAVLLTPKHVEHPPTSTNQEIHQHLSTPYHSRKPSPKPKSTNNMVSPDAVSKGSPSTPPQIENTISTSSFAKAGAASDLEKFTLFSQLPIELRLEIWHLVMANSRSRVL